MWESFKHKSVKVKRRTYNMDQTMDIFKLNKFNFFKKKVQEFGRQRKNLDRENRRPEQKVEIFKDTNDVCE